MTRYVPIGRANNEHKNRLAALTVEHDRTEKRIRALAAETQNSISDDIINHTSTVVTNSPELPQFLKNKFFAHCINTAHTYRAQKIAHNQLKETYTEQVKRITELKELIKSSETEVLPEMSIDIATAALANSSNVRDGSILINANMHDDDSPAENMLVSWVLDGIILTPNTNPYININGGKLISIPLPPLRLSADLCTGRLTVIAEDYNDVRRTCFGQHSHPHIMNDHTPCLGDYEYAVYQCVESADLATLNDIMVAYLSSAHNADTAGKSWPYFLPRDFVSYLREVAHLRTNIITDGNMLKLHGVPTITQDAETLHLTKQTRVRVHTEGNNVNAEADIEQVVAAIKNMLLAPPEWLNDVVFDEDPLPVRDEDGDLYPVFGVTH